MVKNYIVIRINGKFSNWHKFGIQLQTMADIPKYMVSINRNISQPTTVAFDCGYFLLLGHGVYVMDFERNMPFDWFPWVYNLGILGNNF